MSASYPVSVASLINPVVGTKKLGDVSQTHSVIETKQNEEIMAIETALGVDLSNVFKLVQIPPQVITGGTPTFVDIRTTNAGTVNRNSSTGLVSSIVLTGLRTLTFVRNAVGFVISMADGTKTWTYVRDINNNITSWSVA